MSSERRFRLRGNTVKPPAKPAEPFAPEPRLHLNVQNLMEVDFDRMARRVHAGIMQEVETARRLASNAPLPGQLAMTLADLEMTYGLPRRGEFMRYDAPERYRGYSETTYPDLMEMQLRLFTNPRAVDYLLSINHETYQQRPITCPEDAFLVMCGLLAYMDRDTDDKRILAHTWMRRLLPRAYGSADPYSRILAVLSAYGRTATLGSLPSVFFSQVSSPR